MIDAELRQRVRERARNRCEYCQMPQSGSPFAVFHVEHVVARQHGGTDDFCNLALARNRCNAFRGPNLSSIDPETHAVVPLFNPRVDDWHDHFRLSGVRIVGQTPVGRASVRLLNMNFQPKMRLRAELLSRGELE